MSEPTKEQIEVAARAVMETRVSFGWTYGKRNRVMAIDLMMAEAALKAGQPK